MDFPELAARTRRFSHGAPRAVSVAEDGSRVIFLRSAGPEDPADALWLLDVATAEERLVADPATLLGSGGDVKALSPASAHCASDCGSAPPASARTRWTPSAGWRCSRWPAGCSGPIWCTGTWWRWPPSARCWIRVPTRPGSGWRT
ncbi:hypothetical protein GCM10027614_60230 [Micromonospora vulcania]